MRAMTLPWRLTKDELPVDDGEVFAAISWADIPSGKMDAATIEAADQFNQYGVHSCTFYRRGPAPEDAIFSDRELQVLFATSQVHAWIYRTDLAASVPSEFPAQRSTSEKIASLKAALDKGAERGCQ